MSQKYTEGFKIQAVEKALNRSAEITLTEVAEQLGVSRSALQRWVTQSKNHLLEDVLVFPAIAPTMTTKEKRPQDWTLEERLQLISEQPPAKSRWLFTLMNYTMVCERFSGLNIL